MGTTFTRRLVTQLAEARFNKAVMRSLRGAPQPDKRPYCHSRESGNLDPSRRLSDARFRGLDKKDGA
jgi:hypothetical protein